MLVEADHLTKYYKQIPACVEICLSLKEGQVFGLLGPNGAGKSTLVKMFLGLVYPSSGEARINGRTVKDVKSRRKVGYLPELFRLYHWLDAQELLSIYARMYGIPASEEKRSIAEVLEIVGLTGRGKDRIEGYSKGMQQRLALAGAIIHKPVLVFLDEPTSALDPLGRRDVRDIIMNLRSQGTTIFLNSHLLGEVEMTCTHLGFISQGRLVATGGIEEFMEETHQARIEVDHPAPELIEQWARQGVLLQYRPGELLLRIEKREEVPAVVRMLVERNASVYGVEISSRGLEEVFFDLVGQDGGEQ